jgi:hypothetical protein
MLVGILVVHHEVAVLRGPVNRNVADIVVVVAKLPSLRFRSLADRVEF